MRIVITAVLVLLCGIGAFAQTSGSQTGTAAKPSLTVDQIIEKSIVATGGREANQKVTSFVMKGTLDIPAFSVQGAPIETYAKGPDKRFTVINVEGFGQVADGYDGKAGWHSDPQEGLIDLAGTRLEAARLDAQLYGDLNFKALYPKAEVTGQEKIGGRDCWVVKMTSSGGVPFTRYYDAETFMLVKVKSTVDAGQGPAETEADPSDYKDVGNGAKMPRKLVLHAPGVGEITITYTDIKVNVPVDDAKFAKPKS